MKNDTLVGASFEQDMNLPSGAFVLSQKFQPQPTIYCTISAPGSLSPRVDNGTVNPIAHDRNPIIPA